MDFFKFRKPIQEEHGAGDQGTPSLVAKYKAGTPGQSSAASTHQPARKGDKLNAKDEPKTVKEETIEEGENKQMKGKDPCWKGYQMVGTKKKNGKEVPNCVPTSVTENKDSVRAELKKIADRMDQIEKSGGRVPLTDPLHQKAKQLRAKLKMMKEYVEDPEAEKNEMALTKLHFIEYAAEEIMEYIEMGGQIEEWYQVKLAKVHADMEGLHSHMEGEKRRLGMDDDEDEDDELEESASYKVDVEGLPTMYISSKSPAEVKANLRKLLKRADMIKSVDRVMDTDVRKAFRLKAQGKEEMQEGVMKNIKRVIKGTDAESRAAEEGGKMMAAAEKGDKKSAYKYAKRVQKLQALTKKEGYKSDAQRKAVWASRNEKDIKEKLDPSQGAGAYIDDFMKSDAPQFKGKTKKERQKMAVAAYLSAKRGD